MRGGLCTGGARCGHASGGAYLAAADWMCPLLSGRRCRGACLARICKTAVTPLTPTLRTPGAPSLRHGERPFRNAFYALLLRASTAHVALGLSARRAALAQPANRAVRRAGNRGPLRTQSACNPSCRPRPVPTPPALYHPRVNRSADETICVSKIPRHACAPRRCPRPRLPRRRDARPCAAAPSWRSSLSGAQRPTKRPAARTTPAPRPA